MLQYELFLQKVFSYSTPCPLCGFVLLNPTPIMPNNFFYLTICSLVSRQGKQAVSSGAIKWPVEIALSFLGVCFFKKKSQYSKNFLLLFFLKNGRVLYSFENKAYLKPCYLT